MNLGSIVFQVGADTRDLRKAEGEVRRATSVMASEFKKVTSHVFSLKAAIAGMVTGGVIKSMLDTAKSLDALDMRIRYAVGSTKLAEDAWKMLQSESTRLGLNLETAAKGYGTLAAAARGTSLEGDATREIFLSIAEASAVMSLSNEDAQGALIALSQIMSKGKVQAEELRGQLGERIPGAFQTAARAMNMTTAELDKFMADGKLTAETFLPRFAAQIRKEMAGSVGDAVNATGAQLNLLGNAWLGLKQTVLESGVLQLMIKEVKGLTAALQGIGPDDFSGLKTMIDGLKDSGPMLGDVASGIGKITTIMGSLLQAYSAFPDWVKGPAGTGIIARILTGSWTVAGLAALIDGLVSESMELTSALSKVYQNIQDVQMGIRDWDTGKLKGPEALGADAFLEAADAAGDLSDAVSSLGLPLGQIGSELEEHKQKWREYSRRFEEAFSDEHENRMLRAYNTLRSMKGAVSGLSAEFGRLAAMRSAAERAATLIAEDQKKAVEIAKEARSPQKVFEDNMRELKRLQQVSPETITAEVMSATTKKYTKEMNDAIKAMTGGGGGGGGLGTDYVARLEDFKDRVKSVLMEIQDLRTQNDAAALEQSGRFYDAEKLRMEQWGEEQKEAYRQRLADLERSYGDMVRKIDFAKTKGKLPTLEAVGEADKMKADIDAMTKAQEAYNAEVDRTIQLHLDWKKKMDSLAGAVELAQVNMEYYQLRGEMEKVHEAQIAMIEASAAEKIANSSKDIPGLAEAYRQLYEEQKRIAELTEHGSFLQGVEEGFRRMRSEIPTTFELGISAVDKFKDVIDSAAGAFADFVTGGKTSFSDMIISMIRDLIKLQMQMMLMKMFAGQGGGGGFLGSLLGKVGGFLAGLLGLGGGGLTTQSGGFFEFGMDIPVHHQGRIPSHVIPKYHEGRIPAAAIKEYHEGRIPSVSRDEEYAIIKKNEAVIPMPAGKIPVDLRGSLQTGGGTKVFNQNFHISIATKDAASFRNSETQLKQMMARAVREGSMNN